MVNDKQNLVNMLNNINHEITDCDNVVMDFDTSTRYEFDVDGKLVRAYSI